MTPDAAARAGRQGEIVVDPRRWGSGRVGERDWLSLTWRVIQWAAIMAFLAWNAWWLWGWAQWARYGLEGNDWSILATLNPADPYRDGSGFRWSVPAAWLWAGVVVPMGFVAWTALHFVAIATIRHRWVALIAISTFPFWHDVVSGNVLTFCFVAAWWALSGNRVGVVAFCILAALVPRPLMIPVLGYLLIRDRTARVVFPAAAAGVVLAAIATGQLGRWLELLTGSYGELGAWYNLSPTQFLGLPWLLIGWPLAAWAWMRGRLGIASLLFTPYVVPYYAIFALLELRPVRRFRTARRASWPGSS